MRKIFERAVEFRSVVDAGHQHELCVEIDPGSFEPAQIVKDLSGVRIPDQRHAQIRIRRVDRHVHRADFFPFDAFPVGLIEIREGHEGAVQHRIAEIVVHHVERLAHAFGNLLDETERTRVFAEPDAVKCRIGERDSPELVPFELEIMARDQVTAVDLEADRLRLRLELKIECVEQRFVVDRNDLIARLDTEFMGKRSGRNRRNHSPGLRGKIDTSIRQGTHEGHRGLTRGSMIMSRIALSSAWKRG